MKKKFNKSIIALFLAMFLGLFYGCGSVTEGNLGNEESKVTVNSIEDLKNTENFKEGALEHILEGEINSKGQAVGYHYENMPGSKGSVREGSRSEENEYGVYTAKVSVDGVKKTSNGGKSSFFPLDWDPQQVVDAINEAYEEKVFKTGNTYYGYSKEGVKINMYIDESTDKIISAFPEY